MDAEALLARLADGTTRSGTALARELGVTRAAVWKRLAKFAQWGLRVEAERGRGYRLAAPIDLLDRAKLLAALTGGPLASRIGRLEIATELPSTNRLLLEHPAPAPGRLDVCLAEFQTAGRGRRGRSWRAPLGSGLCLSVGWRFRETPDELAALTLAIGVVVRRVLAELAGIDVSLKWPNDLVHADAKLGGILVEMSAEAQGGCHVVAGVGLNVRLPAELRATLCDWPHGATDLASAAGASLPARTDLALALVGALADLLAAYPAAGFAAYRDEWRRADYLAGKPVRVAAADAATTGIAAGIATDGALLVKVGRETRRVISGDVSVRAEP